MKGRFIGEAMESRCNAYVSRMLILMIVLCYKKRILWKQLLDGEEKMMLKMEKIR